MTKPPICKVCGKAHWGSEAHVFADAPRRTEPLDVQLGRDERPIAAPPPKVDRKLSRPLKSKVDVVEAHKEIAARYPKVLAALGPEGDALAEYLKRERERKAAYMRAYRAKKKGGGGESEQGSG